MRRFRLTVDIAGRGALVDLDTGQPVDGVRAVAIVARVGEPTRVVVEYLADVEVDAAACGVEVGRVEVVEPVPRQPPPKASTPGRAAGGRARAAALSPERRREIARQGAAARWSGRPRGQAPVGADLREV